ncbi:siderophore-interacting protein [Rugosimonospora africana]|uniref:Siderophore-interacting protein n=1 Tax=Rugosimonospora africana TaxID=556532 RepID=A0A8J3VSF1_9ACTN|nr:siderophore-interacting protein [Rugosimonospora africana]
MTRLTPRSVRITLTGDDLAGFAADGPASHLKLVLPVPGQDRPTLPTVGPEGLVWPAGQRPLMRTYTPRRFDPVRGELDIDFVLHDNAGPASAWATRARPGDNAVVVGPRGRYLPDPAANWQLIAGDETALPAIATILEVLQPGVPTVVIVEVADAEEQLHLDSKADLRVTWVYRGDAIAGSALELAVAAAELPAGDGQAFVAAEAGAMRRIRRHLLTERGIDADRLYTRGYWKYGEVDHPDHDTGED